jgi:hypothetical protein
MQSCDGTGMALVGIVLIYTCFAVEFIRQTLEQLLISNKDKILEIYLPARSYRFA